ncbi:hypothetical protein [Lachnoclostridium sp. An138]|uniref:hypothetical protein n=1 Tax=Lachnoclostridium sp. An138 TaxID=1965560 RepID=UPI000B39393F|nr:hypothetical protein [Lachnoclostridium sp. An138]OUQ17728.1 hypothetical protein B5E82_09860 [Lachnoclostridium sp. An138]
MGKAVDITEKLTFDENPKLLIKGKELEVKADAPTVLKAMSLMDSDSQNVKEVIKAYELIFPEESRREIDNMKLSFRDLMVVIQEAIKLIIGDTSGGE